MNNGFSNPFGPAVSNISNSNMNQGYTGYQSFVIPQPKVGQTTNVSIRKSKIVESTDKKANKRLFKGKYELNAEIPVKYNTVNYFMLVENVRINNENALRELKRGKACDILNQVLDSLEFLSYIQK